MMTKLELMDEGRHRMEKKGGARVVMAAAVGVGQRVPPPVFSRGQSSG